VIGPSHAIAAVGSGDVQAPDPDPRRIGPAIVHAPPLKRRRQGVIVAVPAIVRPKSDTVSNLPAPTMGLAP
jgi:hypothetical protein